jgi:excisionase family DNA binding protein
MDKLLDLAAVAELLGISPVTAKIWASKRRLPVVKVGRLVRVSAAALEAWVQENTALRTVQAPKSRPKAQKMPKTARFEDILEELSGERARQRGEP